MARMSWDDTFIAVAKTIAEARADCTRRRVGAVITVEKRIVSTGYNGAPSGHPGCLSDGACPRGQLATEELAAYSSYDTGPGACVAIHAEQNAILFARQDLRQAELHIWTDTSETTDGQPCGGCWKMIYGAGIRRVVWLDRGQRRDWQRPN